MFDVFIDYKSQLKAYNKRFFDPFCRTNAYFKNKIAFQYEKDKKLITTIGQLNFLDGQLEIKLQIMLQIIQMINKDMNTCNKNSKRKKYKKKKENFR